MMTFDELPKVKRQQVLHRLCEVQNVAYGSYGMDMARFNRMLAVKRQLIAYVSGDSGPAFRNANMKVLRHYLYGDSI